jgi:Zn-dependent protease
VPGTYIVVAIWALCVPVCAALLHELGHAWTARAVGWNVIGLRCGWYGSALVVDTNGKPEECWKGALGGLAATGVLVLGFLAGVGFPQPACALFGLGFAVNAAVLLTNFVPLRWCDGGQVVAGIRQSGAGEPSSMPPAHGHSGDRL